MSADLFNRYLWLVDTIRRYGRISRAEIDRLWRQTPYSGGEGLPRRTFHNYRVAAEELFGINICCHPSTYEYYIEENGGGDSSRTVNDWLLNTMSTHRIVAKSPDVADRIVVDAVPSAQRHLATFVEALRCRRRVQFDYAPYYRIRPSAGVVFEPLLLKLFRQRWYVIGRNVRQNRIKTYALDRISKLNLLTETFAGGDAFNAEDYFAGAFGIVVDSTPVRNVVIRTDARQAKYLRALPLHKSQVEYVHDQYSDFHYRLRITGDLVQELLGYGSRIQVIAPETLRRTLADELRRTLRYYDSPGDGGGEALT